MPTASLTKIPAIYIIKIVLSDLSMIGEGKATEFCQNMRYAKAYFKSSLQ